MLDGMPIPNLQLYLTDTEWDDSIAVLNSLFDFIGHVANGPDPDEEVYSRLVKMLKAVTEDEGEKLLFLLWLITRYVQVIHHNIHKAGEEMVLEDLQAYGIEVIRLSDLPGIENLIRRMSDE